MDEQETMAPFARHHRTAEMLLRTLQQALAPQFETRGTIGREDLDRAVGLIVEHGSTVMPLFAGNCRACLEDPITPRVRMAMFQPDGRRKDFVTRLLFSSVVRGVPESTDPLTGATFPRVVAPGLQANLSALFYDREWEAMNADAATVFQKLGDVGDEEVWAGIDRDEALPMVVDAVFVRVMLRFKQFSFQRQSFMRRMVETLRERRFAFTDDHFVTVFESLFGHLRDDLRTGIGRARMDTRYGDETSGNLMRVFDQFDRHREEIATPVRGLGGSRRPAGGVPRVPGVSARLVPTRRVSPH
ncbi:hypothetical protein [Azospirillum oleiclasticum]|uniref:hypothetical protein n=1 Tax=Azospirillum oleiclasticum TaxID=2735135 RepID=UPI0015D4BEB4|nr:hypothetical protein [Azospirillum oleiclasticum]